MRQGIAYKLTFHNGGVYIGITRETLNQRIKRHISYARSGKHFSLSCAIRKYGENSFSSEIIGEGNWDQLKRIEIDEIAKCRANQSKCYNMTGGGDGSLGVALSQETKRRISSKLLGRTLPDDHRRRIGFAQVGKVIPDATKDKMRASAIARVMNSPPMSQEQREKRSLALKGKKRSPELMAKIWETRKANLLK